MHPAVLFAPTMFYVYVFHPLVIVESGAVDRFFLGGASELDVVGLVNILGCIGFTCGLVYGTPSLARDTFGKVVVLPTRRRLLRRYALALGIVALAAFSFNIWYSGGFSSVFLTGGKPYVHSPSGYVGELPMLSYPGLLLLALSIRGRSPRASDYILAVLLAMPHLIMATLGGRRGPAFLVTCGLAGFHYLARGTRPRLATILTGLVLLGSTMLFLAANRRHFFAGVAEEVDLTESFADVVLGNTVTVGDEFIVGSAYILAATEQQNYTWGARLVALLFVRPIPKQIWPTKYEDMGLGWLATSAGKGGLNDAQWRELVGFEVAGGSAGGFIADLFMEFSWFTPLVCFLIGRVYFLAWRRASTRGGFWAMLYLELVILSVFLPAQSLGAWLYRVLLLGIPTYLLWRYVLRLPLSERDSLQ